MPRRPKEPEVGYILRGFEVLQYSLSNTSKIEGEGIEVAFNAAMNYFVKEDLSVVTVRATVKMLAKNTDAVLSEIVTGTTFGVVGLEKCMKDGKLNPPPIFVQSIASIAISTTRGVLFSKHAATKFGNVLMPLFNADGLVPQVPWNVPKQEQLTIAE